MTTAAVFAAYRASLERGVKRRAFPLEQHPHHATTIIHTGRTLQKLAAWTGHWPALREFLQNTIDHLQLLDGTTGRRQEALRIDVSKGDDDDDTIATFTFRVADDSDDDAVVCTIVAQPDRLVIEQHYTFPLPSRALDTGVPDTTKQGSNHTAGGFGDGFKTAAVALLAQDPEASLVWYFLPHSIAWHFEGATRLAVGSFAKSRVLQVRIERDTTHPFFLVPARDNIMRQVIVSKNIGRSFVEEAVPRLQVFWDWGDPCTVISTRGGGDLVGFAQAQPPIGGGVLGAHVKPAPGVYVRGIWVRPSKITGTIMSFFGKRLQVTGRDRNEVDPEELVQAVVYVLKKTKQRVLLNDLLEPLRGSGGKSLNNNSSWLLRSPRFFNCILEQQKEFVLHALLGIPLGSIFVSRRITKNPDPFIQWASSYLQRKGAPLVPIERGANRILFQEVSEAELKQRCVQLLTKDLRASKSKGSSVEVLRSAFRKLLTFMGGTSVHVLFSADVRVAFVHGRHIFVPEAPLTRELLVKVLNVCQVHLGGIWDGEKFSSVVQAIFEQLPAGRQRSLTVADVNVVVKRAKEVTEENAQFLAAKIFSADMVPSVEMAAAKEDIVPRKSRKKEKVSTTTLRTFADLEQQIQKVTRKRRGRRDDDMIIPPADFGKDDAGHDSCLISNSTLESVSVDARLGGGSLLCDAVSVSDIDSGAWDASTQGRICVLRSVLAEAVALVGRSIPSLGPLLGRIRHGYDAANDTYDAFCDGRQVVINLYAYMPKLPRGAANAPRPRTLIHDFVVTVTHELAHFLEPGAGHGPVWRDTHMKMVMEVMAMYVSGESGTIHGISDEGSASFPVRKRKRRS